MERGTALGTQARLCFRHGWLGFSYYPFASIGQPSLGLDYLFEGKFSFVSINSYN